MPPANPTYESALQDLYSLQKYGIKFGLSQTANLLAGLGDPHLGRSFIHVGGSNGKGSVACLVESALRHCGYRTGLFTSPHLVHFRERFRINGQPISREETIQLYDELREAMDPREPPTFFEAVTAMALACFRRRDTDIAVIEVGMGGRLDATNLITPLVSVITNISLEHREFLGDTLLEVAGEKAGIVKKGVPLLTGATDPGVLDLLLRRCLERKAPRYLLDRDFFHRDQETGLTFSGDHLLLENLKIGLRGRHQRHNAAMALAVLDILSGQGWPLSHEGIARGCARAWWPGRMHQIASSPRLVLDGAHNPAAIQELARSLRKEFDFRRLLSVVGIMEDKDARAMLASLLPLTDHFLFTRPEYPRAMNPHTLQRQCPEPLPEHQIIPSLPQALDSARAMAGPEDLVLVCGSLFTVGEALSHLDPATYPPELSAHP
jgi:dihydrofolate synthase/folylpolyglutamate synthase